MMRARVHAVEEHLFRISFSDDSGFVMEAQRSYEQLSHLSKTLQSQSESSPDLCLGEVADVDQIEDYLNFWLRTIIDNPLVLDTLVNFMESEAGGGSAVSLQIRFLRGKVTQLVSQNHHFERALKEMTEKAARLEDLVNNLQLVKRNSLGSYSDDERHRLSSNSRQRGDSSPSSNHALLTPVGSDASLLTRLTESHAATKSQTLSTTPELFERDLTVTGADSNSLSQSPINHSTAEMQHIAQSLRSMVPELVSGEHCGLVHEALSDILQCVQPLPEQVAYRCSVIAFLKRQVRLVLRVNSFECGLHELRCFLPDDATKLTVVLGKLRSAQWHKTISDRLSQLSTQPELCQAQSVRCMDEEYATDQDDEFPAFDHTVSKVAVNSEDATFKVDCQVDATDASVSCNRRGDICMVIFLEEFTALVGKGDLFKHSLLLIRAWWAYETISYVEAPVRNYLNEFCLSIMVVAIFNLHHASISTPLQALCLFLAEYSTYDGATEVITLQGIVPFNHADSNVISLPEVQPHHLLTSVVLEKYWALFNIQNIPAPSATFGQVNLVDEINDDLSRGSFIARGHLVQGSPFCANYIGAPTVNSAQRAYFVPSTRLERLGFNVAHPFLCGNMTERMSARRLQRIQKAFSVGAAQFATRLMSPCAEGTSQALRALFSGVLGKFGHQSSVRPDRIPDQAHQMRILPISVDPAIAMTVNADRHMVHILYFNLVLESVLSEAALLILCTEILKEKKIQPVGEVGKMLAEVTSTPNMSQGLKEKFGGLKKFLEHYNGRFIFSADHPFNPSVTIRSILEAMNLEVSDVGVQALTAFYKAKKSGSKRANSSFSSPEILHGTLSKDMNPAGISHRQPMGLYSSTSISPSVNNSGVPGVNTTGIREGSSYGDHPAGLDNRRKAAVPFSVPDLQRRTSDESGRQSIGSATGISVSSASDYQHHMSSSQRTIPPPPRGHYQDHQTTNNDLHFGQRMRTQEPPGYVNANYPRAVSSTHSSPRTNSSGLMPPPAQQMMQQHHQQQHQHLHNQQYQQQQHQYYQQQQQQHHHHHHHHHHQQQQQHRQHNHHLQQQQPPSLKGHGNSNIANPSSFGSGNGSAPTFDVRSGASLPLYARPGLPTTSPLIQQRAMDRHSTGRMALATPSPMSTSQASSGSDSSSMNVLHSRSEDFADSLRDFGASIQLDGYGLTEPLPSGQAGVQHRQHSKFNLFGNQ